MKHMHYDEQDLPEIQKLTQHISNAVGNFAMREDVGIFTARELDFVKAQTYEKKFPELKGLSIVPVTNTVPAYAETVTYKVYDHYGMAKIIANYADDLPRADVAAVEKTVRVKSLGVSYGYSVQELAASNATGANLDTRKAYAARRAVELALSKIALHGDEKNGLFGLLTHPNIGETVLPSGKNWLTDNPTAQELIDDVRSVYDAVLLQSNGTHTPNTMILPMKHLSLLKRTIVPDTMGKSVLAWLQDEMTGVKFVEVLELQADTGKSSIVCGEFDTLNVAHEMAQPFTQLPAQERNLELVVVCHARTAGVLVTMPLAFTKAEC